MKKYLWLADLMAQTVFFSLFYTFEYWWSSDTVGNDLIGGEEKQKPARTPAFVWTKEVFRT